MPTWSQVKAAWSAGWKALSDEGTRLYEAAIRADPTGYLAKVQAFLSELSQSRASLDRMKAKLPNPATTPEDQALVAKVTALEKRYQDLAAGFYADTQPASTGMGVAPVLVVGGLVVGVAGVAWAVAAYEYAVNLREQTALAEKELDARVEASRQGRELPPSTIPPQPDPVKTAKGVGGLLLGGLALAAAAIAVPVFLKKKGA